MPVGIALTWTSFHRKNGEKKNDHHAKKRNRKKAREDYNNLKQSQLRLPARERTNNKQHNNNDKFTPQQNDQLITR